MIIKYSGYIIILWFIRYLTILNLVKKKIKGKNYKLLMKRFDHFLFLNS